MGVVRFVMIAIGAALLFVAVAAILLLTRMQPFVRAQAAKALTGAFGGKVSFASAEFNLAQGAIRVSGIEIRNPEGFKDAPAIVCPELVLCPDWRGIFAEKSVFNEVRVERMKATLHYELGKGTNLTALLGNLQTYLEKHHFRRPFSIRRLVFTEPSIEVSAGPLPAGIEMTADSFETKDFGNAEKNAPIRLAAAFAGALRPKSAALTGPAAQAFELFKKELGK